MASTFASKAYIFNRENLERYTAGVYCRTCPHAKARSCPFERDYDALEQVLFPQLHADVESAELPPLPKPGMTHTASESVPTVTGKPLLWVHTDSLNPDSPMLAAHPDSPAVFVWDTEWLTESNTKLKRIQFLAECLQEMPGIIELRMGDPAVELLAAARTSGTGYLLAQRTADPRLQAAAATIGRQFSVVWYDPPAFVESSRTLDLKRFSRYWQRVQSSAMEYTRSA